LSDKSAEKHLVRTVHGEGATAAAVIAVLSTYAACSGASRATHAVL
jgi:hypothetical protein